MSCMHQGATSSATMLVKSPSTPGPALLRSSCSHSPTLCPPNIPSTHRSPAAAYCSSSAASLAFSSRTFSFTSASLVLASVSLVLAGRGRHYHTAKVEDSGRLARRNEWAASGAGSHSMYSGQQQTRMAGLPCLHPCPARTCRQLLALGLHSGPHVVVLHNVHSPLAQASRRLALVRHRLLRQEGLVGVGVRQEKTHLADVTCK